VKTLHHRLLFILLALFALTWWLLAVSSYLTARYEVEELLNDEIAHLARVLGALSLQEIRPQVAESHEAPPAGPGSRRDQEVLYQIWKGNTLLLRSPNAPTTPIARTLGYTDQEYAGRSWRVYGFADKNDAGVQIFVAQSCNDLVESILLSTLWPILFTLPLLGMLIWGGVTHGLRPLRRVAAEIAQRSPTQLQPIALEDIPEEVQPIAESLNQLLQRLEQALESERRFTANAAHELRTPLAGLLVQAQVALRAASDGERTHALEQIVRVADRSTRLVNQLLTLARLDPDTAERLHTPTDLGLLAEVVLAEYGQIALEKGVDLGLDNASHGTVLGSHGALQVLLRNLLDNAIRHTPAGGGVEVSIRENDSEVALIVADDGPGIPPSERERVFDRFHRPPGSNGPGCGLGLSIVHRIAELHGATIRLDQTYERGGLRVTVMFPPPKHGTPDTMPAETNTFLADADALPSP
jgi:two-component system, OmpR family, sensor histidine kinase QseC